MVNGQWSVGVCTSFEEVPPFLKLACAFELSRCAARLGSTAKESPLGKA